MPKDPRGYTAMPRRIVEKVDEMLDPVKRLRRAIDAGWFGGSDSNASYIACRTADDFELTRNALREALQGWEDWLETINDPTSLETVPPEDLEAEKRIAELRKLL